MGVIDTLRSMVESDGETTAGTYGCRDCGARFEEPDTHPRDVECPECGSDYVFEAG